MPFFHRDFPLKYDVLCTAPICNSGKCGLFISVDFLGLMSTRYGGVVSVGLYCDPKVKSTKIFLQRNELFNMVPE